MSIVLNTENNFERNKFIHQKLKSFFDHFFTKHLHFIKILTLKKTKITLTYLKR